MLAQNFGPELEVVMSLALDEAVGIFRITLRAISVAASWQNGSWNALPTGGAKRNCRDDCAAS